VPAFHVDGPAALLSRDRIRHKPAGRKEVVESKGWLPPGRATVGITAGASTPDVVVGAVVERVAALRGTSVP
jgi:4-hydroxy-3-methylbut-2-enyl diphosphate reductase